MKLDTKIVRASTKPDEATGAVVPPIFQTATYVLEEVGKDKGFDYTRASNPSRQLLEQHLAELKVLIMVYVFLAECLQLIVF